MLESFLDVKQIASLLWQILFDVHLFFLAGIAIKRKPTSVPAVDNLQQGGSHNCTTAL
jgi:hypothetical protein